MEYRPQKLACPVGIEAIYAVGRRQTGLQRLVGGYKFLSIRASACSIAELMAFVLPELDNAVLVPVPTSPLHVRRRGFDHTLQIARQLSRVVGWRVSPCIERTTHYVQHDASRQQRKAQTIGTFLCRQPPLTEKTYVLVDDVLTTGATLGEAARALRAAGAWRVVAVVLVWQPLD